MVIKNKEMIKTLLKQKEEEYGLCLDEEQVRKLILFAKILKKENRKFNLTRLISDEEIVKKHFIDSVIGLDFIEEKDKIIDIGCGGGFPSVPLKIMRAEQEFVLIDSLNKRISFLEKVIKELRLKNIEARHMRIEEAGRSKEYRERFDIVVARAVAPLNILIEYALPLLKKAGRLIAYKGEKAYDEIEHAQNALQELHATVEVSKEYRLEEGANKRVVLSIRKIKETPKQYPRLGNRPRKNPL